MERLETDASDIDVNAGYSENDPDYVPQTVPELFNQLELNDMVADLNLSKETAKPLASRLKEKQLLVKG